MKADLNVNKKINLLSLALKNVHIARRSHLKIEISRNRVGIPEGMPRKYFYLKF